MNLKEASKGYEPKKTHNVADLEAVSLSSPLEERSGTDASGKEFSYSVILVTGEEYRVPNSVLEEIQTILAEKPETKTIKVKKSGEGMNTKYKVFIVE